MQVDTLILGAGAAGLMAAAHCGGRVLLADHARAPGEKIRISGGGRCNFTNTGTTAAQFLSANPHFAKSALSQYTPQDFIDLVTRHGIPWHEKTLGQLFCDNSAKDIIAMLRSEMQKAGAELWLETKIGDVIHRDGQFVTGLTRGASPRQIFSKNLIVATGGKSIPKMGATGLAYQIAEQFGLPLVQTRPGLVPLTFSGGPFAGISGVSTPARVSAGTASFDEALLFTHRGLSGPAILQASSYWQEGADITVNLAPANALYEALRTERQIAGRKNLTTALAQHLPTRLVEHLAPQLGVSGNLADQSDKALTALCDRISQWTLKPSGSEGYRTAEVTLGGVSTQALSSKTMAAKSIPGLYFIGECVDVTGWLGGYNFQWAWASAMAAARHISQG
ncbi:NAD(P)/FAD-dependent oxidoreductase [Alphaproteobacteria bacterium KMM 3653]|uniref:NAD(P)/FAD-dependent oxidoreductase n=1 Tax=Harenicola maris TaxID=2841044 RepID=A0AAP2CNA7_9RHOB|nr:NAD(P)/FAD-dependent oxidoreductase [Harenicola maris]